MVGETSEFCTCTTTNRAPNFFLHQQERNVCKVDCREKYNTTLNLKVTITQQQVSEAVMNDLLKKRTFKGDVLKRKTLAKSSNVILTDCTPGKMTGTSPPGLVIHLLICRAETNTPIIKSLQQNP
jgi:hypothetical protein